MFRARTTCNHERETLMHIMIGLRKYGLCLVNVVVILDPYINEDTFATQNKCSRNRINDMIHMHVFFR